MDFYTACEILNLNVSDRNNLDLVKKKFKKSLSKISSGQKWKRRNIYKGKRSV